MQNLFAFQTLALIYLIKQEAYNLFHVKCFIEYGRALASFVNNVS